MYNSSHRVLIWPVAPVRSRHALRRRDLDGGWGHKDKLSNTRASKVSYGVYRALRFRRGGDRCLWVGWEQGVWKSETRVLGEGART